jgi:putative long chain acyl-CoA synthase
VRRFGATHVSYTWTSLRSIVDTAAHPYERHAPIRMVMGSGMPRNLWKRFEERFPDVRVLEFYASVHNEAILANLTGEKPGCMGKPLPGTAEVRVAAFDLARRTMSRTTYGFARETLADEVGLLLARVSGGDQASGTEVLRGVFVADDVWRSTGDLFLRDHRGDLWLAGAVADIVDTVDGPVLPAGARFCLESVPSIDLVVTYGVQDEDAAALAAAVTLRPGGSLSTADLNSAFERLPGSQRPRWVQVLESIPLTTWSRPMWRGSAAQRVPVPGPGRPVWRRDATGDFVECLG